jgi:carboxyl-terminal processing protease
MQGFMKGYRIILTVVLSTIAIANTHAQTSPGDDEAQQMAVKKFEALLSYINNMYVDSVKTETLVEDAFVGMLEELDPHSIYIPKKEVQEMNAPLKGSFTGVGIRFQILKDTLMVVQAIPGGPSEKAGIRAGDKFIAIDDEVVAGNGLKNSGVRKRLLGDKDTKVKIMIQRKGSEPFEVTITRDKIPIFSLDASYMATPEIGYVKLNNFSRTTIEEFRTAVYELQQSGMKDLILDLQGNGGGYLSTAIDLADEFLSGRKLVVYTEGRMNPKSTYATRKPGLVEEGRLIVLIDESSASASEIVSGAIQDWDRGIVVGRRSFGKGLVQKPVSLPDGSMVRLTTSRYYTPTGRSIQKSYEGGSDAYRKEKYERFQNGEAFSADSIKFPDSLKFETLTTARLVYGGGGIMPDFYVPVDTTETSQYFSSLIRKGVMNAFILNYIDKNRKRLHGNYPDFENFKKDFTADDLTKELIKYAEKEGIDFDNEQYKRSERVIKTRIKAMVAQNLWDYKKFYEIINQLNNSYNKAIKILEDGSYEKVNLASN